MTRAADEPHAQPWLEIIVPARNEAARLPAGLSLLCQATAALPPGVAILIVDSASTDGTAQIVRQWPAGPVPVRLIRVDRPGKGIAVRAGLLASRAQFVGFCDADMATDLSALSVAVGLLTAGHRMIVGSRAHPDSAVESRHSMIRVLGATVFRRLARAVIPAATDTQCGFKFFAGPVARAAAGTMTTRGYAFDIELIGRCQRLGAELTEIPVRWRDIPGSTFSSWRHSAGAFGEVASIWLALRSDATAAQRAGAAAPQPVPGVVGLAAAGNDLAPPA